MMAASYQYSVRPNGIHQFEIAEYTDRTTDLVMDEINQIFFMSSDKRAPLFILLEVQNAEIYYLRGIILRLKDVIRTFPEHKNFFNAIVLKDSTLLDIADTLMRTLIQREQIQYFTDPEKARFWLRLEKQKLS